MIATASCVSEALPSAAGQKLPPGERDFELFRFVRVELHSTRAAAEVFRISQTRVRQVVSRVVEYLLATAREGLEEDEDEPAGSLAVAEQIARMQLEHLYHKAMEAWRKSQETSLGQTKFLSLAARIALALAKVPMHAPPRTREELEECDEQAAQAPPVEDCSPLAVSRPAQPVANQPAEGANELSRGQLQVARTKSRRTCGAVFCALLRRNLRSRASRLRVGSLALGKPAAPDAPRASSPTAGLGAAEEEEVRRAVAARIGGTTVSEPAQDAKTRRRRDKHLPSLCLALRVFALKTKRPTPRAANAQRANKKPAA